MKSMSKPGLTLLVALVSFLAVPSWGQNAAGIATRKVDLKDGNSIEYGFIEPEEFDASKEYPILLALPPGAQDRQMVQALFNLYWSNAGKNGWIVVAPVAPKGKFFNNGAEDLIPEFLEKIRARYKPVGGRFHLAGVSNGGTSVFRIAGLFPDEFHSLMAMPGYPKSEKDRQNLAKLKSKPIALYVGAEDTSWVEPMESTAQKLKEMGANVSFEKVEGQGHVIKKWQDGKKLFTQLNYWNDQLKNQGKN